MSAADQSCAAGYTGINCSISKYSAEILILLQVNTFFEKMKAITLTFTFLTFPLKSICLFYIIPGRFEVRPLGLITLNQLNLNFITKHLSAQNIVS